MMAALAALGWGLAFIFLMMWLVTDSFRQSAHEGWRKSLEERRRLLEELAASKERELRTWRAYLGDRTIRSALVGEPWEEQ